jgi:hypothetical protein
MKTPLLRPLLLALLALPASAFALNPFAPATPSASSPAAIPHRMPLPLPAQNIEQHVPAELIGEVDGKAMYRGADGYVFEPLRGRKIVRIPEEASSGALPAALPPTLPPIPGGPAPSQEPPKLPPYVGLAAGVPPSPSYKSPSAR